MKRRSEPASFDLEASSGATPGPVLRAAAQHLPSAGAAPALDAIERTLTIGRGRNMTVRISGDTIGDLGSRPVVLALHGTPGSRLKFQAADDVARVLGVTLLSVDRWGYGGTDAHPAPSLAAFGADMAQFLDQLGIDRVAVVGVSGGGPFAAAVAAHMTTRVTALALVAPVGQIAGADRGDGFRLFHRFCFSVLPRIPGATAATFHVYRGLLLAAPSTAAGMIGARAAEVDRRVVLDPAVRERLAATISLGLQPGVIGPVTDLTLFSKPWEIVLDAITAPCRIWLGTLDRNVPVGPVKQLARDIPGGELVTLPGEGHFWIALNYARVLEWICRAGG
jgi:pimeloyl-ACP methyl ester carboxylesterase